MDWPITRLLFVSDTATSSAYSFGVYFCVFLAETALDRAIATPARARARKLGRARGNRTKGMTSGPAFSLSAAGRLFIGRPLRKGVFREIDGVFWRVLSLFT